MDLKLPKLGEGADSGVVVSILVKEGDRVEKGQTILELENEKAVAPIPATAGGTVDKIKVKEGDRLSVGQTILSLSGDGAGAPGEVSQAKSAAPAAKPKKRPAPEPEAEEEEEPAEAEAETTEEEDTGSRLPPAAAPSIRYLARELGIDLRKVRGSERGGRIVLADLRAYIQRLHKLAAPRKAAPGKAAQPQAPAAESIDFSKWGPIKTQALSPLRATISRRMAESWNTIPHVTQFDEADLTAISELRKKYVQGYEGKGARLTLTSFVLKAVAATLKKHPIFNSSLDEASHEIVFKEYVHIGIAVDTEAGLIVPVIRDVDKKDLVQLSKDLHDLAERARLRKVALEEMKGGTFTISNQGGIGGAHFTPIINKPEAAILGLGRGAWKAVVREKKIEPRMMLPIGLSYDHRLIDGANAARFVVDLLQAIEQFPEADVKI